MATLDLRNHLLLVFISFFVCMSSTNAFPSMKEIENSLSAACNDIENLPEKVCSTIVGSIKSRADSLCQSGVKDVCSAIPWALQIIISTGKCEAELNKYICGAIDLAIEFVENECEEELEKVVIGHGCDADGNKVSICDGLPTSVEGICTMVVDTMCEELPAILEPLVPYCQEYTARIICEDAIGAAENTVKESSWLDWFKGFGNLGRIPVP